MTKTKKAVKEFIKTSGKRKLTVDVLKGFASNQGYKIFEYVKGPDSDDKINSLLKAINKYDYAQSVHAFSYADNNRKLLFIEQFLTYQEQLIALSHEVGHIVLKHPLDKGIFTSDIEQENEANEFAFLLCKYHHSTTAIGILITTVAIAVISTVIYSTTFTKRDAIENETKITVDELIKEQNKTPVQSDIVLVTRTGEKYHMEWCSEVIDNATHEIEISEALRLGYEPCKVCRPDMHFNAE